MAEIQNEAANSFSYAVTYLNFGFVLNLDVLIFPFGVLQNQMGISHLYFFKLELLPNPVRRLADGEQIIKYPTNGALFAF